jgi:RNA ligase (TIGR02306 family)
MTERKMATVRRIDEINPIEGADAIEVATVGGWKVVVKKGEFKAGDLAVYCEIDSFIPTTIAPFLTKPDHYPKQFEGVEGERLRTVRLRGQLSQGLLLPLQTVFELPNNTNVDVVWTDVSEVLGIKKYEAPVPACLAGEVKGMFPGFIPKTDQERIQNLTAELESWKRSGYTFEVTEKLDGTSMTAFMVDGVFSICSRNLELKPNPDNSMFKAAQAQALEEKLRLTGRNLALQGELIGLGIQGNKYKMTGTAFYVFDIYDIDAKRYLSPMERKVFVTDMRINHVPVFQARFSLAEMSVADLLRAAEGKSVMGDITGPEREGEVYKCNEAEVSFKAISNKFLLKNGD